MIAARRAARPGLSLLEVLIALAVFLISYIAIWQLMSMAGDQALELTNRNRATQPDPRLQRLTRNVVEAALLGVDW